MPPQKYIFAKELKTAMKIDLPLFACSSEFEEFFENLVKHLVKHLVKICEK